MTKIDEALGRQALAFAAAHVNAALPRPITVDQLLAALRSDASDATWQTHSRRFFDETDLETLSDLARSGLVSYAQLAALAKPFLPSDHPTREWLDERAAFSVA